MGVYFGSSLQIVLFFSSCDLGQNDKLVACDTHFLLVSCPLVPKPALLSLTLLLICMKVDRVRECLFLPP